MLLIILYNKLLGRRVVFLALNVRAQATVIDHHSS